MRARRRALTALGQSLERGEADRARAMLLTLSGWTSRRIAKACGVRADTVRLWRSLFMTDGVAALRRGIAPGPAPVKATCALAVARELLDTPMADRPNWTLPRLAEEIEQRAGVRISPSRLSVALRKKGALAGGALRQAQERHTLRGHQSLPRRRPGMPMPSTGPVCAVRC
ncbi:MAG: helix-turn-helix domain-containing protein [Stellaceae bacterium]